jgi:hypothetical protein
VITAFPVALDDCLATISLGNWSALVGNRNGLDFRLRQETHRRSRVAIAVRFLTQDDCLVFGNDLLHFGIIKANMEIGG